jgi:class 3 adenylate cyclase
VIGHNPNILNSGKNPSKVFEELWATLNRGEVWQGELINRRKNGELYWEFTRISPVKNKEGKITHYVATKEDITRRKQIETELERKNKELQVTNTELEILNRKLAEAQKEKLYQLNKAYERFVPHQFLSLLGKKSILEVQLGDQVEKEMTILFSDIRGFATISEEMTPQENFDFINAYLGQMEPIINEHGGFIDKYIGDAIMALFPVADDAVQSSIAMLKKLREYNKLLQKAGFRPIKIGIGLHTGPLMLGTVGGQNRMDGTVIADAVNIASRVENLTKTYNTPLLMTVQTYRNLLRTLQYNIRIIDTVKIKGKSKEVTVYEVFDADAPIMIELKAETLKVFKQGLDFFHCDDFRDACDSFEKVLQTNESDEVAQIYLKRCKEHLT